MPIPTALSDLSSTPSLNSPQGTESAKGTVDDYLRAHASFIRQLADLSQGATVTLPSASTVAIGFAASLNIALTGTATITAFDTTAEGSLRYVQFLGAMTLTHNAAVMVLPGSANIVTTAGDAALFKSLGSGKWVCLFYQRSTDTSAPMLPLAGGTMAGQIRLKEGTAAAPGLSFDNDGSPDTGLYHISDGVFGVTCNTMPVVTFSTAGLSATAITAGTVTETSDERKKQRWQRMPADFIAQLATIKKSGLFQWKKGKAHGVGLGAQSLEAIFAPFVHTDEDGNKSVQYGAAAMVTCVELAREVVRLQARLDRLEDAQ